MISRRLATMYPIFDSIDYLEINRTACNDLTCYAMICGRYRLLPFQFSRPSGIRDTISTIKIICYDGSYELDVTAIFDPAEQLQYIVDKEKNEVAVLYYAAYDFTEAMPCGIYYTEITSLLGQKYYGELLRIVDDITNPSQYLADENGDIIYDENNVPYCLTN